MSLLLKFQEHIRQQNLFSLKDKLLLAVSGGIDSVVLCELCKQAGFDFTIVHCNFQLRKQESVRDEQFVRSLGEKYSVEVVVKKFDTEKYAAENKLSIQQTARELRYAWFEEIIDILESKVQRSKIKTQHFLLTAHHADDNIETLLMNFCRGTGLNGLGGIPLISSPANLRRPLLTCWKEELIHFGREHNLDFVEDSSNQSSKYTRNLFRNQIIPLISKAYPQVKENLNDNIDRFKEIGKLYKDAVDKIIKALTKKSHNEIYIPVKQLMEYKNRALIFEIISPYGFTERQVDEVIKLAESETGKFIQSPATPARIIKFRHWFIISMDKSGDEEIIVIEETDKSIQFASGTILFETTLKLNLQNSNLVACLDRKEINFPLLLRKWKTGDYFYPLGMKKKKKLARFFIDQKLSKPEKENVWVLEMNKKIIWILGHRIDERFKITEATKKILTVRFSPAT